jgi:hypothetical protein
MSLTYFLNDLEMVPIAPIITGITLIFTFHMRCIFIVRSLYIKIFSASFLISASFWIHLTYCESCYFCYYYYYYYYYYSLSSICTLFTITYLRQTIFLGYIILQLFCSNNLGQSAVTSHVENLVPST